MSVTFLVGLTVFGLYSWYKKGIKNDSSNKNFNTNSSVESDDNIQTTDAIDQMKQLARLVYEKQWDWDNFIAVTTNGLDLDTAVKHLIIINSLIYEMHQIQSAGFFVTEKNLKAALDKLKVSQFSMTDKFKFFAVGTENGTVVFFKNEFYENSQTGETAVVCLNVEEVLSPVVGVSFLGQDRILAVAYKNGTVSIFNIKNDELHKYNDYSLGGNDIIHFSVAPYSPIFVSIDSKFEKKIWNIIEDGKLVCIETENISSFFDTENKIFLNSGVFIDIKDATMLYFFAVNNLVDKKIEIYGYVNDTYNCIFDIQYEGEVVSTSFVIEEALFTFYQKGGESEGVHVYNFNLKQEVVYFSPKDKQQQHPEHLILKNDKVFCLYADALMDMWHCDVDRRKIAHESLKKIVNALPDKLKIEFLRQFGVYMQDRSESNYNLLVQIGSFGLSKDEVQAKLLMLQFLPPMSFTSNENKNL